MKKSLENMICADLFCGNQREVGRRLCRKCLNKIKAENEKKRRAAKFPKSNCLSCKKEIIIYKAGKGKYCRSCYLKALKNMMGELNLNKNLSNMQATQGSSNGSLDVVMNKNNLNINAPALNNAPVAS